MVTHTWGLYPTGVDSKHSILVTHRSAPWPSHYTWDIAHANSEQPLILSTKMIQVWVIQLLAFNSLLRLTITVVSKLLVEANKG